VIPFLARSAVLLAATVAVAAAPAPAPTSPAAGAATTGIAPSLAPMGAAPALNWALPIFTDKEGYRSMTLRGSAVRPVGKNIAVTDLNITIFTGDAKAQVDSVLLSSSALFLTKEQRASGDGGVRFIRDDFEVTGNAWTYDHATRKLTLDRAVRTTFRVQLNDILK